MKSVIYATGNQEKFRQAQYFCQPAGIELIQASVNVDEIQGEDVAIIARDKAHKIFDVLGKPVITSDDSWSLPGLKGFPGPYMKSMVHWFTTEDWLRLTLPLSDRRAIIRQTVVYQDERGQQLFQYDVCGLLLTKARGGSASTYSHSPIVSFDGGRHSAAEIHASGGSSTAHLPTVWQDFAKWYSAYDE